MLGVFVILFFKRGGGTFIDVYLYIQVQEWAFQAILYLNIRLFLAFLPLSAQPQSLLLPFPSNPRDVLRLCDELMPLTCASLSVSGPAFPSLV